LLEQRDRLAAIAAFEEDEPDGLALEPVEPALLAAVYLKMIDRPSQ
jgi:hypothetical protein